MLAVPMLVGSCQSVSAQGAFVFPIEGERPRVTFGEGEVRRWCLSEGPWTAITLGTFVSASERIMTMKGARPELQLPDKTIIRFDKNSEVRLLRLRASQCATRDVRGWIWKLRLLI